MSNEPINREVAFAGQQVRRKVILVLTLCSIIPLLLITYAFNSPVREFLGPLAGLADSVSIPAIMVFTLLLMLGGAFVVWDIATALSRAAHLSNQARPDLTAAESGRKDEIGTLMNSFARMLATIEQQSHEINEEITRVINARPTVEAVLRDTEQLRGSREAVTDALEQVQNNRDEIESWSEGEVRCDGSVVVVQTLEGELRGNVGDWIIRGVAGEFYPCKDEIFLATYERVEQP